MCCAGTAREGDDEIRSTLPKHLNVSDKTSPLAIKVPVSKELFHWDARLAGISCSQRISASSTALDDRRDASITAYLLQDRHNSGVILVSSSTTTQDTERPVNW